jgi:hypothetical protein
VSFAWYNAFPIVFDDGPTEALLAYEGLHEAAGVNAGDPQQSALAPKDKDPLTLDSIADLEVKCDALAIGAAATWIEHAMHEGFPDSTIDGLSAWERILGIDDIAPSIVERQAVVTRALTRIADASNPALGAMLYAISPALALDSIPYDLWTVALFGKNFSPYPNGEGFYGLYGPPYRTGSAIDIFHRSSAWPSYSDAFKVRVRYTLTGSETQPPARVLREARTALHEVLPAWFTFEMYTLSSGGDGLGFYFDGGPDDDSFFDVTAFGET